MDRSPPERLRQAPAPAMDKPSREPVAAGGVERNRRRTTAAGGSGSGPACQAERCTADLADAKRYHRRHKVCEEHSKAAAVMVAGLRQRFCQQCSRFHELLEFDDAKRSCRRRLAGHNERRRKGAAEAQGEGSSDSHCNEADHQDERIQIGLSGKHFQIR